MIAEPQAVQPKIGEHQGLVPRRLDGVYVKPEAMSSRPLAIVIENHVDARPQAGLSEANLVYEFLTEGGITRFVAFYDSLVPMEKIGPVRSCRLYFSEVAGEYQSVLAHVGGSPDCLDSVRRKVYNLYDLNQYFNDPYFWRASAQSAPHNVYTSVNLLNQYLEDSKIKKAADLSPWLYKDNRNEAEISGPFSAEKVAIDYSYEDYRVEWRYQKKDNSYARFLGGKVHKDQSGTTIKAVNVIVQYAKTSVMDNIGRLKIKLDGRGEALVFQDGLVVNAHWKKSDEDGRTRFYFKDNNEEIVLNRGITWIEVVPNDREAEYE